MICTAHDFVTKAISFVNLIVVIKRNGFANEEGKVAISGNKLMKRR